jgi:lipopolysaccharide transport system ATP-binding protein
MSEVVIRCEGLGKQYRIGANRHGRYVALRDVLTERAKSLGRRLLGRALPADLPYEEIWALKDVSFEVRRGECVGVIGRNGAGKSTLLKLLSRITEPTTGRIHLRGRVASLLEVGTGFHPELTGRENIYLNGAILGMRRAEIKRKFDEIVAFAEIEKFLDTPVKRYSSGMYMRLAFAVAAHLEPEILVVDEVLAVGDALFQKKCLGKMGDVARAGRTVLFVSHNMPAVARLCTRGVLLEQGQMLVNDSSSEVVALYLSRSSERGAIENWEADTSVGNEALKLRRLGLYRADGTACPVVVGVGDELHLRIRYRVAQAGLRFRVGVNLTTQGICVFSSMEPEEAEREVVGCHESTVIIPAHLLAEGEYTIHLSIFASRGVKSHFVRRPDALTFQVVDPIDGTSARGDYTEGWAGVVRPRLHWSRAYVGGN